MDLIESLQAQLTAVQRELARPERGRQHLEQSLSSLETSMQQGCAAVAAEGSLDGQIAAARLEATRLHKQAARRRALHESELSLLRGKLEDLKAARAAERLERPAKQAAAQPGKQASAQTSWQSKSQSQSAEPSPPPRKSASKETGKKAYSGHRLYPEVYLMRMSQLATFYGCEEDFEAGSGERARRSPPAALYQDSVTAESFESAEPAFEKQNLPVFNRQNLPAQVLAEPGRPAPDAQFRSLIVAQYPLLSTIRLAYNSALFFTPQHVLCAYASDQPPAACAGLENGVFRANSELQLLRGASVYIALFECRVIDLCGCCFGDVFIDVFAGCELVDFSGGAASSVTIHGRAAFVRVDEGFRGALDGQIGRVIVTTSSQ